MGNSDALSDDARTVTFLMPFSAAAANQELPAGAYLVQTDEELIQELSFPLTEAPRNSCGSRRGAGNLVGCIQCKSTPKKSKRR